MESREQILKHDKLEVTQRNVYRRPYFGEGGRTRGPRGHRGHPPSPHCYHQ